MIPRFFKLAFFAVLFTGTVASYAHADCCGKVIKVSDGDTLWLLCDGATERMSRAVPAVLGAALALE